MARLEEQGVLVREQPRQKMKEQPAGDQSSWLHRVVPAIAYALALPGVAALVLLQASGSDASSSYAVFFARVFVYVVRESWAVVKHNAVPLSGNLLVVAVFALGVFQAAKLAVWIVRRLWPPLIALGVTLVVLKIQGT
jgi:hypothetical protein